MKYRFSFLLTHFTSLLHLISIETFKRPMFNMSGLSIKRQIFHFSKALLSVVILENIVEVPSPSRQVLVKYRIILTWASISKEASRLIHKRKCHNTNQFSQRNIPKLIPPDNFRLPFAGKLYGLSLNLIFSTCAKEFIIIIKSRIRF